MVHMSQSLPQVRTAWAAPRVWRGGIACVTLAFALAGALIGRSRGLDPMDYDPHLLLLLRFMAGLKAVGALAALGAVLWRLGRPIPSRTAALYGAALAGMAMAPGLIWWLGTIPEGALAFHAGLIAFLVLAWSDDLVRQRRPSTSPTVRDSASPAGRAIS